MSIASSKVAVVDPSVANLVQHSWHRLRRRENAVAQGFYRHLFARRPHYQAMFTRHPAEQEKMFFQMICLILGSLEHGEGLNFVLRSLGRKHIEAGVAQSHFLELSEFLIAAFNDVEPLSAEENQAWRCMLDDLAARMLAETADSP